MQDKNKNKLMRESFSHFNDYKTTLHFFVRNTLIRNTRPIFDSRNNIPIISG